VKILRQILSFLKSNIKINRIGEFSFLNDGVKAYEYAYQKGLINEVIMLGIYQSSDRIKLFSALIGNHVSLIVNNLLIFFPYIFNQPIYRT